MTEDPAIAAFVVAHTQLRIRASFRLLGVLAMLITTFVISLDSLGAYHDGVPIVIPLPFLACWGLGHLVAMANRVRVDRNPRVPRARLVR